MPQPTVRVKLGIPVYPIVWLDAIHYKMMDDKNRRHAALNNLTITEFSGKQNKKNKLTNFPNLLCG
ncbi:MAG: hypothetical protein RRY23_03240 [Alistipes sp.]